MEPSPQTEASQETVDMAGGSTQRISLVLACIIITTLCMFLVVGASTALVRDNARITILAAIRLAALGVGYMFVGVIYIPIVVIDHATQIWPVIFKARRSPTLTARNRTNSDVSDLDLGEARYCLEKGLTRARSLSSLQRACS